MKIENNYKKIYLEDNAPIEGLIKITIEKLDKNNATVRVDLVDNDGIELVRFGPREVPLGGKMILNHVKITCEINSRKPGF